MIKAVFIFIVTLFSFNAFSETLDTQTVYSNLLKSGVKHFSYLDAHSGHEFDILVRNKPQEFEHELSVFDSSNQTLKYQYTHDGSVDDGFVALEVIQPYPLIISIWKRGVHGERIVLIDPVNAKEKYNATSAWPIE
ncbi:MAG: hypothetical protein ISR69_08600 [Gammaproteobacteria bacterium]|nr:hypothetical protein [Gammaproteobacteria bacterium]